MKVLTECLKGVGLRRLDKLTKNCDKHEEKYNTEFYNVFKPSFMTVLKRKADENAGNNKK